MNRDTLPTVPMRKSIREARNAGFRAGLKTMLAFGGPVRHVRIGTPADDLAALSSDFAAVGNDLRSALASYKPK